MPSKRDSPDLLDEIEYRKSIGQVSISLNKFEAEIRLIGYRFDRGMDCCGLSRYMTGPRTGKSYQALGLKPVQLNDGIAWCSVNARRDDDFTKLKAIRENYFSVVNGRIAEF